jgi:hypothetical protein
MAQVAINPALARRLGTSVLVACLMAAAPVFAQTSSTGGTGGSAAAGGTSATTLGTGGTSTDADGSTGSSLATGGAAAGEKSKSMSKSHETGNDALKGQSKAMAHDGGTFSKSKTKTTVGEDGLESRTRTMSHEPGEKPVKSTSEIDTTR